MTFKVCRVCGEEKHETAFRERELSKPTLRNECSVCEAEMLHNYRQTKKGKAQSLFDGAKKRAVKKNIPFTITRADIEAVLVDVCPILGIPLETGARVVSDKSPSLDRVVPSKGYVPGNIQVISMKANKMKGDWTAQEMIYAGYKFLELELRSNDNNSS